MARWKKPVKSTDTLVSTPKKPKVKPLRPTKADLPRVLDELNVLYRPEGVPENAFFLTAFVNIPGDNTQRSEHWAAKKRWLEEVVSDFQIATNLQDHPGCFASPQVRILSFVSRVGDDLNLSGRLKKVIDTLQVPQHSLTGRKRGGGVLGLFQDDKILKNGVNFQAEERYSKAQDRKVMIWVWGE